MEHRKENGNVGSTHLCLRMCTAPVLTQRLTRLLILATVLFCTTVLFAYLYTFSKPEGQQGKLFTFPLLQIRGDQQSLLKNYLSLPSGKHDVTLVTSYLDLGSFQKGEGQLIYKPKDYRHWMKTFHLIRNPVIAFFDNDRDLELFKSIRNMLPKNLTKVVKISRSTLWAFSLRSSIEAIFLQPSYPSHHPNTVLPDYSCAMHAKYEFMAMAVNENPFNTKYFAWLDMGLFRDLLNKSEQHFTIQLPPKFDEQKVGYGEVYPLGKTVLNAKQIVEGNVVWVCGCFFIARYDVMQRWTNQYRAFTEKMIQTKWISTDQQVLYYMFQPQHNQSALLDVQIQPFKSDGRFNPWFSLAYMSVKPWKI